MMWRLREISRGIKQTNKQKKAEEQGDLPEKDGWRKWSPVGLTRKKQNSRFSSSSVCQSPASVCVGAGMSSPNPPIRVWSKQSVIGPTTIHPPARTRSRTQPEQSRVKSTRECACARNTFPKQTHQCHLCPTLKDLTTDQMLKLQLLLEHNTWQSLSWLNYILLEELLILKPAATMLKT